MIGQFASRLGDICQHNVLGEKWLLAPSLRIAHQWMELASRQGRPLLNVHARTLSSLAMELAAPSLAAHGWTVLPARGAVVLLDTLIRRLGDRLVYLSKLQLGAGMAEALYGTLNALRLEGVQSERLTPECFENGDKASDLRCLLAAYEAALQEAGQLDYAALLRLAADTLVADPAALAREILLLLPDGPPWRALEARLLAAWPVERLLHLPRWDDVSALGPPQTDLQRLRYLHTPDQAPPPLQDGSVEIVTAIGERNEVRQVLRRCREEGLPFDEVELLYSDSGVYPALIHETVLGLTPFAEAAENPTEPPITFAEGIACRFSRPGRLLRMWVQWINSDFPQTMLLDMIREGLLELDGPDDAALGQASLARLLQSIGIGFGRDRYPAKIMEHRCGLDQQFTRLLQQSEASPGAEEQDVQAAWLQRQLIACDALLRVCTSLLECSPPSDAATEEVLASAESLLRSLSRAVNELDQYARQRLLEEIDETRRWLRQEHALSGLDPWAWLETLPAETRVLGSGPRPGRLHVAPMMAGGHSGRPQTFILGLDDGRFPGAGLQDPLMLDSEREAVAPGLVTGAGRVQQRLENFHRLLMRLSARVVLSYASQAVSDQREMFPSTVILSAYRLLSGKNDGDQSDLHRWLAHRARPGSFAPDRPTQCLDLTEWWMWRLCEPFDNAQARLILTQRYPHLALGDAAVSNRQGALFSEFDGHVPAAGRDLALDASEQRVLSANQLQMAGRCPLAYFYRYGLHLQLPAEASIDPNIWLDNLASGSLLHELFESFMQELIDAAEVPDFERDLPRLQHILHDLIHRYQDLYPTPGNSVFHRKCRELNQIAATFLREESEYCRATGNRPRYPEASLGMSAERHGTPLDSEDPIPLALANGKSIRLRGRIDRIDQIGQGAVHSYGIWDYKTGSTWGYQRDQPFRQGRVLQPYLYLLMASHRLRAAVSPDATVEFFGFFFPGVRAAGQRICWTRGQLRDGPEVLRNLGRLIGDGAFLATNDDESDCTFCDFVSICGNVAEVARQSREKLACAENTLLHPFRQLREL